MREYDDIKYKSEWISVEEVDKGWSEDKKFHIRTKGKQPFYTLLSASLLLTKGDFSLKVWGDNLANTHYNSFYFVSIGNAFLQQGKPARCGVTLRMNFKSK